MNEACSQSGAAQVAAAESPAIEIRPAAGLIPLNLHEVWEYRELAFFMLWREVKGRYRQMAFGPLWIVLSPIFNMVIFSVIFGMVAKLPSEHVPYPLFSYSALLPWTFFTTALFATADSLLQYKDLIAKVYFPRLLIPIVGVLSALVDFAISFVILLGMMLAFGYVPGWTALLVPVYLALGAVTALAVGLWAATWIVHFRDVSTILGYVARVWMYGSPVVYATTLVPAKWRGLYHLNPTTNMIEGFRWALLGVGQPSHKMLLVSFLVVVPVLISGAYYFRRTERSIVDIA